MTSKHLNAWSAKDKYHRCCHRAARDFDYWACIICACEYHAPALSLSLSLSFIYSATDMYDIFVPQICVISFFFALLLCLHLLALLWILLSANYCFAFANSWIFILIGIISRVSHRLTDRSRLTDKSTTRQRFVAHIYISRLVSSASCFC